MFKKVLPSHKLQDQNQLSHPSLSHIEQEYQKIFILVKQEYQESFILGKIHNEIRLRTSNIGKAKVQRVV